MIAAPANGIGLVGVYPDAQLYSFDTGQLTVSSITRGLDRAASLGRGVVNLSLGGALRFPLEEHVLLDAYDRGLIVVAAAGNSGEVGSPTTYPAYFPHVLTVAATDINDDVADFSTRSTAIDLAAPGHDVPVAVAGGGYDVWSGTSFAAPIVSGAAAWLWTARPELDKTQVMEILRRSARDIGAPGRDSDSGYGILDIPAALALPAPIADPLEPNDDVDMIVAGGMFGRGKAALTGKGRPRAELEARLDVSEDREDVYSVWVGPGQRVTATLTAPSRVDLELWKPGTRSVYVKGWERKQNLAASNTRSGAGVRTVAAINRTRSGAYFFVDAFLPEGSPVRAESYKLSDHDGPVGIRLTRFQNEEGVGLVELLDGHCRDDHRNHRARGRVQLSASAQSIGRARTRLPARSRISRWRHSARRVGTDQRWLGHEYLTAQSLNRVGHATAEVARMTQRRRGRHAEPPMHYLSGRRHQRRRVETGASSTVTEVAHGEDLDYRDHDVRPVHRLEGRDMAAFTYEAINAQGLESSGVIHAPDTIARRSCSRPAVCWRARSPSGERSARTACARSSRRSSRSRSRSSRASWRR